jgi:hypothetical protein
MAAVKFQDNKEEVASSQNDNSADRWLLATGYWLLATLR